MRASLEGGGRLRSALATCCLTLALSGVLSGCVSMFGDGRESAPQISQGSQIATPQVDPQEVAIAEAEHPKILAAYGGTYEDSRLETTVARIVGRLVAASPEPWRSYRLTILNSPIINAFALPGGYVYVTRGLLALTSDSSELAAVIAHEMAHVTQRHAFARAAKVEQAQMVGRVVQEVVHDPAVARTAMASSERSLASFSQAQELEADQMGIETMAKAGYDPFGAARFLHAMASFNTYRTHGQQDGNNGPDFLSSHPSTPQREALAYQEAIKVANGQGERDQETYLAGIDGLLYGDDPVQGYVRGRQFLHARLGLAFQVPENFVLDNNSKSVLATDQSGMAMRFDGTTIPDGTDLIAYLQSGWINGLQNDTIRTTSINGLSAVTATAANRGFFYRIAVVRFGGGIYRFLFASRTDSDTLDQAFLQTVASFRPLTPDEKATLHPLRIQVATVAAGDTVASLSARMGPYVDMPAQLFRVLNGLDGTAEPQAGGRVKLVVEGN